MVWTVKEHFRNEELNLLKQYVINFYSNYAINILLKLMPV